MKVIHVLFFILLNVLLKQSIACDIIHLSNTQKMALEVAQAYQEIISIQSADYTKLLGLSLNNSNEIVADFLRVGMYLDEPSFKGSSHLRLTIRNSGSITSIKRNLYACDEYYLSLNRINDKIKIVSQLDRSLLLEFENGKIVIAEEEEFGNYSGAFEKYRYIFFYNEKGKISSVQSYRVFGKGKNYREAIESNSLLFREKKYEYSDSTNEVTITIKHFYNRKNKRKNKNIISYFTMIRVCDMKEMVVLEQFNQSKPGEIVENHEIYFDSNFVVTKSIKNKFIPYSSVVTKYRSNSQGFRDTIITNIFDERNEWIEHRETYYTYTLKAGGDESDICSFNKKNFSREFDKNGEVIEETDGDKIRRKENGVWGPWIIKGLYTLF